EAVTCAPAADKEKPAVPERGGDGRPAWRWQSDLPPIDSAAEYEWLKAGKLKPEHARFCPANAADPQERIRLHSGTVRWNEHRKRWVLLAGQIGGKSSFLGEVWYAEARHPTGPFEKAVKVATHDRQSFYNVCHHGFLDRDNGRLIYDEGTYTSDFSGNTHRTPRYDYNQILYRLDLDAAPLRSARAKWGAPRRGHMDRLWRTPRGARRGHRHGGNLSAGPGWMAPDKATEYGAAVWTGWTAKGGRPVNGSWTPRMAGGCRSPSPEH